MDATLEHLIHLLLQLAYDDVQNLIGTANFLAAEQFDLTKVARLFYVLPGNEANP